MLSLVMAEAPAPCATKPSESHLRQPDRGTKTALRHGLKLQLVHGSWPTVLFPKWGNSTKVPVELSES